MRILLGGSLKPEAQTKGRGPSLALQACMWLLLGTVLPASLVAADPAPSPADREFFEKRVRPLLVERCFECHSAKKQRGGLRLDSRVAVLKGGDTGSAVVPGKPEASLLVRAIGYGDENLQMPPKGKLAERDAAVLMEWVRRGLPFPDAATTTTQRTIDIAAGKKFWSFQPLKLATPPAVGGRTRIDGFLLAELAKRGLAFAPEADRRALIRRVSFDLVGLPPSPEEVEAFVRDDSPDAYERLVERLLASPQHGERWARFWLDLARYCDIPEDWAKRKNSPHLYRDWVVSAINADMPYDRFVTLQLAADQVKDAKPEDRAALGFIGLSPSYWKELKLAPDVIKTVVAEEWEERIHTLGSTFLGLTLACARCHDHKFDPVTTQDYYALAGVFASTREADLKTNGTALAPGVEDASLFVLPDGPHKTKLDYKPGVAQDVAIQVRGNPASPGSVVPRRFLAVLSNDAKPFKNGSGRLELAQAILNEGGALAARVLVNRVWMHHFGVGLVDTPSNFGMEGSPPTHPALLDDLAARFVASGWSLCWLHREIVLSAAYRQSSTADARKSSLDPDNRLLGRMSRRRLEVEAWRDAMLAVTGTLDHRLGGPPQELTDANNRRRTLYGTVKRRELSDLLRLHDFPDPTVHSASRTPTTTPLQQLFVLNSPFLRQQATALANRVQTEATGDEARVRRVYQLLFGRLPSSNEMKLASEFLTDPAAWPAYCQALLGGNELLFVD